MSKSLKYYMNLDYTIEINKLKKEDGGGYHVCIPQLGKYAFQADGDTIDEAIKNLEIIKEELFAGYLKKGIEIPEPENTSKEEYSGKFLVRVPKELHRKVAVNAKESGISLNQYVQYLISTTVTADTFEKRLDKVCNQFQEILDDYHEVHYDIQRSKEPPGYNQTQIFKFKTAV